MGVGSSGRDVQDVDGDIGEAQLELGRACGDGLRTRPDDDGRARAREGGSDRTGGKLLANGRQERRAGGAVRLVDAVGQRLGEEVGGAGRERGTEERRASCGERGVRVAHRFRERCAGSGRRDGRLGDERDRDCRRVVGEARDPRVPREADAARERCGKVVGVAFELDTRREEFLGARGRGRRPRCQRSGRVRSRPRSTRGRARAGCGRRTRSAGPRRARVGRTPGHRDGRGRGSPSPSTTSSSFHSSSATAAQSNPGPRFAELAGARTRTALIARRPRSRPGRDRPRRAPG